MTTTPLTVLDLVPISSGSNAAQALRNSIDLAQQAERLGYTRYWFAEHHLNPGVAGTSPAVVLALTAAATSTIRLGSGAVQMGHRTALATVEEFGLLDAVHPGRFDLGLGRSGGRPREPKAPALAGGGAAARVTGGRTPNGLLIPPRFSFQHLLGSPRFAMQKTLLQLPQAEPQNYTEQVGDVLALLAGTYRSPEGEEAHVVPGEGAALQVWILGSSGGESAEVGGQNGLRFAANYHVSRLPWSRRWTATGPRSGLPRSSASPTSACQPTSSWPAPRPRPVSWPPVTACGCAASAPPKAPSSSPPPSRLAATSGATLTASWSPTASTPSSSAPRARSRTSWSVSATPPKPTS